MRWWPTFFGKRSDLSNSVPGQTRGKPGLLSQHQRHARFLPCIEALEDRCLLSAAHDIIGLTALRADPAFSAIDGRLDNGTRIGVAVIDTGVLASHQDLRDRFLVYVDPFTNTVSTNVTDARDPGGHGTHVAGIVLGGFSPQVGDTIGAAPEAGLVAMRGIPASSSDPLSTRDAVLADLNWVLQNHEEYNIQVVNLSLGTGITAGAPFIQNFNELPARNDYARVIDALEAVGVTVVAASGNSFARFNEAGQSHPAVFSTLSVANTLPSDFRLIGGGQQGDPILGLDLSPTADTLSVTSQRSTLSNQVAAPGSEIVSTYNNGGYQRESGTSMASPLVAGSVALMQDAAMTFGGRYLTTNEVTAILRDPNVADVIVDGADPDTYRFLAGVRLNIGPDGRVDRAQVQQLINAGLAEDLLETGQMVFRVNIYRAIQAVQNQQYHRLRSRPAPAQRNRRFPLRGPGRSRWPGPAWQQRRRCVPTPAGDPGASGHRHRAGRRRTEL
jgi:subtilisin family serine protease